MLRRELLVVIAIGLLITGCTMPNQTAATQEDAMLQKADEPIHGEVGAFYGHSIGH